MVLTYECGTPGCTLNGIEVPDLRCLRSDDGKGRICSECGKPMKVSKTINTSTVRRDTGRTRRATPRRTGRRNSGRS